MTYCDVKQGYIIILPVSCLQQDRDQSEQLQQQLAALDDSRATETHQVEKLHDDVRKAVGQIEVIEQQVILRLHLSMLFLLAKL